MPGMSLPLATLVLGGCCVLAAGCCDRPEPNPYEHKGPYAQLALGGTHTCVRDASGKVTCWKYGRVAEAAIPKSIFTSVASGGNEACGIEPGGSIACWGSCAGSACTPPPGAFVAVTVGEYGGGCALEGAGRVTCWGGHGAMPKGSFAQIDYGAQAACGVTRDRDVVCWGLIDFSTSGPDGGMHEVSLRPPPEIQGRAVQVDVGRSHACALLDTGAIACWGDDASGQASAPTGSYKSVVATRDRSCALSSKGEVVCWGPPISWYHKTYGPPPGRYVEVGLGDSHACARRADGTVLCWGVDQQSQVSGKRWMLVRN